MDIYCPKCSEPWDSLNLRIIEKPCGECKGSGKHGLRRPRELFPDEHPMVSITMEHAHQEPCDCSDESTWVPCPDCTRYGDPGSLPRPHVAVEEPRNLYNKYRLVTWGQIERSDGTLFNRDEYDADAALVDAYHVARQAMDTCCHACDDGFIKACAIDMEDRCQDGTITTWPVCGACGEEFEEDNWDEASAVYGDRDLYCLSCAEKGPDPLITWEEDCDGCGGKGTAEHGGDAMEPEEIRRFKAKEGCPSCNFGEGHPCYTCHGRGSFYDGKNPPTMCDECHGEGSIPPKPSNMANMASAVMDLLPDDIDGQASTMEDFRYSGLAKDEEE